MRGKSLVSQLNNENCLFRKQFTPQKDTMILLSTCGPLLAVSSLYLVAVIVKRLKNIMSQDLSLLSLDLLSLMTLNPKIM